MMSTFFLDAADPRPLKRNGIVTGDDGNTPPAIEPMENGPYRVRNLDKLTNSKGEELAAKPVMALCRCGGSANKPFCDGTHAKNGFSSARETDGSADKRDDYPAGDLTIHDNRGICAHIGRCTDGLPEVFRLGTEPWIEPAGADPESIVAAVRRCPSGALSHSIGGEEHRDTEQSPAILVSKDGPYLITGGIGLQVDRWGEGASKRHYALCRCGRSKNKPFCDGTHWKGFKDEKN
jgi:CDGSH-type Zn-finger protein